jgi:outer membrane receptor protein involved in Fe transport
VLAGDTGETLPDASIVLHRGADATFVTGGITDANGRFALRNVPIGTYALRISFVGFSAEERPDLVLASHTPTVDLGTVRLSPETAMAEGIEVTAQREMMEVKIDRTVYNVQDQVAAVGGSAADVLQDLPSIEVDLDGSISYRGSENVAIHVNGRPSSLSGEALASFLRSLSAESVERVEVIPNPSARYEPDGMAGILNIVLARNRSAGWSGSLSAGVGTRQVYNGSANVGYQNGPWQVFSTYGYRSDTRDATGTRLRENFLLSPVVTLDQRSVDEHTRQSHAWTTQLEYQMRPSTALGVQAVLSTRGGTEVGQTDYVEWVTGSVSDQFARLIDGTRSDLGIDTRLTLDHTFADDHTLSAELRYENDWENEDGFYSERTLLAGGTLGDPFRRDVDAVDEDEGEGTLRLDYVRPMGHVQLETGYQGSLRRQHSNQRFERTMLADDLRELDVNAFDFDEQIHAAYGILSTEVGRFGFQTGLRAEQALTTFSLDETGESFDNEYASFFPSAFLTYALSEGQQMRLSYSKRVNRPRLWQLDPVDDNEDPTFKRISNPFLDPEYVHAFELSYVRHWEVLTLTTNPYFRRTVNEIQWRERFDPTGVTVLTFENAAASTSFGAELIAGLSVTDRLWSNVSVNTYRMVTDASNLDTDLSHEAMVYSGRVNLTVTPRAGLDLQFSQFYRSPVDIAGGRMGARSMMTLGAKQELFDGKATIGLQARDVLNTMGFDLTRRDAAFYQETRRDWGGRQVSVSVSYTFGQPKKNGRDRDRRGAPGDDFGDMEMQ